MNSKLIHRWLKPAIPAALLVAGAIGASFAPSAHIAPLLVAMAIVCTAQLQSRWMSWLYCGLGTIVLLVAPLATQTLPSALASTWLAGIWCMTLLVHAYNSQRRRDTRTFDQAMNAAPGGMMMVDEYGSVLNANRKMERMLSAITIHGSQAGKASKSLVGTSMWEGLSTQRRSLDEGHTVEFKVEIPVSQENNRALRCRAKLARSGRIGAAQYAVQVSDHTNEIRTNRLLNAASNQLRRALSSSADLVLVTDEEFNVTFANDHAGLALDCNASALLGRNIFDFIDERQRDEFEHQVKRFSQQQRNEITIGEVQLANSPDMTTRTHIVRLIEPEGRSYAFIYNVEANSFVALAESKSSHARFSQIFHGSPDAIILLRAADTAVVDFNEGFTRLLGYQREDVIGENETNLNLWSKPGEREQIAERLVKNQALTDHETTLRNATGELVHVEISMRYIDIDGELCVLCVGRDITRRISAEAAMVESEEKFEKVFSESPDGMVIVRHDDGIITDINQSLLIRSGYDRSEIIGQSIYTSPVFLHTTELQEATSQLLEEGRLGNRSVSFRTKAGEDVPSLVSATMLELSGEALLLVIVKDISKLRNTEERLRRSEARFRNIFENAPIGILLADLEGHIFQANHTAATLLAYDEQHMNGIHLANLVASEERPHLKEHLARLIANQHTSHRSERRMICQNGMEIWTDFNAVLQNNSADEPQYFIVQIADITDLKRSQDRMEQLASYDALTGLANRRLFLERLDGALVDCESDDSCGALLFIDLDNFKRVNDTLGHPVGDDLLREVSSRLLSCVSKHDTVGRTGGDEFTILLNNIGDASHAGNASQRILNHLREPLQVSGHPLVVTASIGIAMLPIDGTDPDELMRSADLAMYQAKENGRNSFRFFSKELNTKAEHRLRIEYEIQAALAEQQFELHYQPKIDLQDHSISGVEALIRWNHPERGMIPPDEFIWIAEETGSIIDIGKWIIKESCRTCSEFVDKHNGPFKMAINISPSQFNDPDLIATIERSLLEYNVSPELIEVEITETMIMQDVDDAMLIMQKMSDLGVSIAIDDFGTGYSSLGYLKQFPIDTVKIDRSFVKDIPESSDDMAITRAVIAMAHQLKMKVVAEGVETQQQLAFLSDHDCEYAQGWLFSKALPAHELKSLLTSHVIPLRNV